MSAKPMQKIMFVDDEEFVRLMLASYFGEKFNTTVAGSAAEALRLLEKAKGRYDLVISDACMPGMDGPDLLAEIQERYPNVKRALLTSTNIDEHIMFARQNVAQSIIPKTVPFNFEEVESIITGLLTGKIFGVLRYLRKDDAAVIESYCVKSTAEAREARDRVVAVIEQKFLSAGDMRMALEEVIMNAIYHAPQKEGEPPKYEPFADVTLEPDDYVYVELAHDSEKYAVSVLDNSGALTRETVLGKMERQITGAGVLDESGRGLHMCRLFADRLIINVERGKRTEIIIMNYIDDKYCGFKPIYLNEIF